MRTARTIRAMCTKSQLTAPSRQKRALRALNMHPLPSRQILPATIILSSGLRHEPKHLRCAVAVLCNVLLLRACVFSMLWAQRRLLYCSTTPGPTAQTLQFTSKTGKLLAQSLQFTSKAGQVIA